MEYSETIRVILIEDNIGDAELIEEMLHEVEFKSFNFTHVETLEEGLNCLKNIEFDILLLDLGLPDSKGLETLLKVHDQNNEIPIIILTGLNDEKVGLDAVREGAQDYLVKGNVNSDLLSKSISYSIERNKVEKRLIESEKRLEDIIHGSPVLTFVIDKDHKVLYWNKAIEEYSGFSAEEIVGTKDHWKAFYGEERPLLADLMLEKDIEGISKWFPEKCSKSQIVDGAYDIEDFFPKMGIIHTMGKKGRWLHATASAIKDSEGKIIGVMEILEDITERKKAEKKLKEIIEELERSNDELQQFAYITSHDLQEPLRTITSFTQLLERRYSGKLDKDADEFIEYIVDASVRMKQMIIDLLEYSRVGTQGHEFKLVDVDDVLHETENNLKSLIDENNVILTHDALPTVIADKLQLVQLFQNLISNAIKFKKENEPPKIHISAKKEGNDYVFSVSDNGIGMESKYTDKIFEVFKRLHTIDKYKGTGIGLAVVKRIVERHNGHIWVESELGTGSTFYFTIPINKIIPN